MTSALSATTTFARLETRRAQGSSPCQHSHWNDCVATAASSSADAPGAVPWPLAANRSRSYAPATNGCFLFPDAFTKASQTLGSAPAPGYHRDLARHEGDAAVQIRPGTRPAPLV